MTTVIVIAMNPHKQVLLGQSSSFLMENATFGLQRTDQQVSFTDASDEDAAHKVLLSRIPTLAKRLPGIKIKVPKESVIRKPGYFTGRFYSSLDLADFSFVKGGVKAGENLEDAAKREFEEETGHSFDVGRFQPTSCPNVFRVDVSDTEVQAIKAAWKQQHARNEGELFAIKWIAWKQIDPDTLNTDSRGALRCLSKPGGRRRRTRRKSVLSRTRRKARRL